MGEGTDDTVWSVAHEIETIDITDEPESRALIRTVRDTNEPRILRENSEDVGLTVPIAHVDAFAIGSPPANAHATFLVSSGGWSDLVDTDRLKADIPESRNYSSQPHLV